MRLADDYFIKTITPDWAELSAEYWQALSKLSKPFFSLWADAVSWLTREQVEQMLASMDARFRLF